LLITSLKSTYSRPKLYFGLAASLVLATGLFLTYIQPGTLYTDGSIFSAVALKDINGGSLYNDAWENKPPGIIYLIELSLLIVPDHVYAIFMLGLAVMGFLSMGLLFLFYTYLRSLAISLLCICLTLYFTVYQNNIGDGLCTETYGTFCLVASLACFEHFMSRSKRLFLILTGLFLGSSFWFKEPFILICIPFFLYYTIKLKNRKEILWMTLYAAIPSFLILLLLSIENSLVSFFDTFLYNFQYSSHQESNDYSVKFKDYYKNLLLPVWGLGLFLLFLTYKNITDKRTRIESLAVLFILLSSTLFVFLAPYNLGHYYFPSFVLLFVVFAKQYNIFITANRTMNPTLVIILIFHIYSIDKANDPKFTFKITPYKPDKITERLIKDKDAVLFVDYVNAGSYYIKAGKIHPAFLPVALPVHFDDSEKGKKNRARIWKELSEKHPQYLITTYTTSYFSWHLPETDFYIKNYEKIDSVFPVNENVIYLWQHKKP
jgi:hypothetical protein